MDHRKMTAVQLASRSKAVIEALADHRVTCLSNELADDLANELSAMTAEFDLAIEESVRLRGEWKAINSVKARLQAKVVNKISGVRAHINANSGTGEDYAECGFKPRKKPSAVVPNAPTDLGATDVGYGIFIIEFDGNNKAGSVMYEISRHNGDGDWRIIGSTQRQSYTDRGTPGQIYYYRVRTLSAKRQGSSYAYGGMVNSKPPAKKVTLK